MARNKQSVSSRIRFAALILACFVIGSLLFIFTNVQLGKTPDTIHVFPEDANIFYSIDTTQVLFAGDCVTLRWHIYNVDAIYLNEFERPPDGEEQWCGFVPGLTVVLSSGETFDHMFEYQRALSFGRSWLVIAAFVILLGIGFALPMVRAIAVQRLAMLLKFASEHHGLMVLVFSTSAFKLMIADDNPYWIDELLSVYTYGVANADVFAMMERLANNSLHPPLYQSILYFWMQVFGTSEFATAALSICFVSAATIMIYLTTERYYSKRAALFVAILFSVAYQPLYYSLETRSYAQTLFLSTSSTYIFLAYLEKLQAGRWLNTWLGGLLLFNIGLIMTHYYNILFLMAQGIALGLFLIINTTGLRRLALRLFVGVCIYCVPVVVLLVTWRHALVAGLELEEQNNDAPIASPLAVVESLFAVNTAFTPVVLGLVAFGLIIVGYLSARTPRHELLSQVRRKMPYLYVLMLIILLPILAIIMDSVGRYMPRYMVYYVPLLMICLVITLEQTIYIVDKISGFRLKLSRHYLRNSLLVMFIVSSIFVLPTGFTALSETRVGHYRDSTDDIVSLVRQDDVNSYILYETGWWDSFTDYYLSRLDNPPIRVQRTITPVNLNLSVDEIEAIQAHDKLIIVFGHPLFERFRPTIQQLCDTFSYSFHQINDQRGGYIVFDVNVERAAVCPTFLYGASTE